MVSQPETNETIVIHTSNSNNSPQTEKPKPTNQRQDILKCLKTQADVLGTIQILSGVMVLSLGIILKSANFSLQFTEVVSTLLHSTYPFTGALCFVITGSLSIITEKKSRMSLAQTSLAANILSFVSALVGFILLSISLDALDSAFWKCNLKKDDDPPGQYHYYYDSTSHVNEKACVISNSLLSGILSVMMICTVLEFCLAVLVAVIWWKEIRSDFSGAGTLFATASGLFNNLDLSVFFLPLSHKNKSGMARETIFNPGYEELLTS